MLDKELKYSVTESVISDDSILFIDLFTLALHKWGFNILSILYPNFVKKVKT